MNRIIDQIDFAVWLSGQTISLAWFRESKGSINARSKVLWSLHQVLGSLKILQNILRCYHHVWGVQKVLYTSLQIVEANLFVNKRREYHILAEFWGIRWLFQDSLATKRIIKSLWSWALYHWRRFKIDVRTISSPCTSALGIRNLFGCLPRLFKLGKTWQEQE